MKQFNNLREEALLEKLNASDPTGKWIHDFVHSDNPKFAGKSKKERIRMALGASYGAKRNEEVAVEEVELDEMDKSVHIPGGKEYQAKPVKAKEFIKTVGKRLHKALTGGSDKDQLDRLRKNMYGESTDICPVCETDPCICEPGQH